MEEVLEEDMAGFLEVMYTRAVPTSTFIERQFAQMAAWCRKGPTSPASLAAKHVTEGLRSIWKLGQRRRGEPKKGARASRPPWLKSRPRGAGLTGLQLFQRERCTGVGLERSREAWAALPVEEKKEWAARAGHRRAVSSTTPSPLHALLEDTGAQVVDGPWGLSSSSEPWPLCRHVLSEALSRKGAFARLADQWAKDPVAVSASVGSAARVRSGGTDGHWAASSASSPPAARCSPPGVCSPPAGSPARSPASPN